jgi:hypothetical protein
MRPERTKSACKQAASQSGVSLAATALGKVLAGEADALPDFRSEKTRRLQTRRLQAFLKAAEGIRTLDLLHGKRGNVEREEPPDPSPEAENGDSDTLGEPAK